MEEEKKRFRITFNSPVILIFVAVCGLATLLNYATGGKSNEIVFMTYHSSLKSPMTYVRFITHIFGHANWEHYIGNMTYVLLLGPLLEEKYGPKLLIEMMGIVAVFTGLINYIFFSDVALCGASGVCFALILLSSFTGYKEKEIPITFILVLVLFVGQQVYQGIFVKDTVSQMAHIIGGLIGAVYGFMFTHDDKAKGKAV